MKPLASAIAALAIVGSLVVGVVPAATASVSLNGPGGCCKDYI